MNFSHLSAASLTLCAALLSGCAPDDGSDALERGKAAYGVRDLRQAVRCFEEAQALRPVDVDAMLWLARTRMELGELAAAEEMVAKAAMSAGGDPDVLLLGGQIAWHLKQYEQAEKAFAAVADNEALDDAVRAQGFAGEGVVEMTLNNFHLARVAFLKALRLDRRNASAWYHLALLYRDGLGYAEIALDQFEVYVRLEQAADPRVQKVQRAIIPALKEDIARRIAGRPGVSKRDSAACATLIGKAEAAWKRKEYRQARQFYQEAAATDVLSYPAAEGLARAWLKTDPSKAGQRKALESYRNACILRPSAASTFIATGSLAAKLGVHAQAVEAYSRAVAANPGSLDAIDGLIRALRKAGGRAKVAEAYQEYRTLVASKRKR